MRHAARLIVLLLALIAGASAMPALASASPRADLQTRDGAQRFSYDPAPASRTLTAKFRGDATAARATPNSRAQSSTASISRSRATKAGSTALKETRTGLGFTGHGADRLAQRGVRTPDALDAWRNPLKRGPVVVDELGRPGQKLIGRDATIVINPETNKIVTGYPTSRRVRERLLQQLGSGG